MRAGPLLCRTLYRHAEAMRQSDRDEDRRRAEELAHDAVAVARRVGMHSLISRAEAVVATPSKPEASRT